MTWNYRVVKHPEDKSYAIHEIYYKDGKPVNRTQEGAGIAGNDIKDLHRDWLKYQRALTMPVLDAKTLKEIETPDGVKLKRGKK